MAHAGGARKVSYEKQLEDLTIQNLVNSADGCVKAITELLNETKHLAHRMRLIQNELVTRVGFEVSLPFPETLDQETIWLTIEFFRTHKNSKTYKTIASILNHYGVQLPHTRGTWKELNVKGFYERYRKRYS